MKIFETELGKLIFFLIKKDTPNDIKLNLLFSCSSTHISNEISFRTHGLGQEELWIMFPFWSFCYIPLSHNLQFFSLHPEHLWTVRVEVKKKPSCQDTSIMMQTFCSCMTNQQMYKRGGALTGCTILLFWHLLTHVG